MSETVVLDVCPGYPTQSDAVIDELATIPLEGYEDFWRWMDDQAKLEEQLTDCHASSG